MKNAILKNMEALFVAALVIAGTANFAAAKIPTFRAKPVVAASVDSNMHTVVVAAKRLSKTQG